MATPSQLLRLADHIKLSLLERQRAISLNLPPNTQDAEVNRSLETLREGIEALDNEHPDLSRIRGRYNELYRQFHGEESTLADPTQSLKPSSLKRAVSNTSKSVRFSDSPAAKDDAARAALFPYRDDPDEVAEQSNMDNTQIHAYHTRALAEQDEQLDVLGASVGRQRELSIQIGDELDEQAQMLDDVDGHVTRHQTQLDRARKRVGNIARKAKDNMSITVIIILIVILVLLIVLLN